MQPINSYSGIGAYSPSPPDGYSPPPANKYLGVSSPSSSAPPPSHSRPHGALLGSVKSYFRRLGFALFGVDAGSRDEQKASFFDRFKDHNADQISSDPNEYSQEFDPKLGYWPSELADISGYPGVPSPTPATVPPPAASYSDVSGESISAATKQQTDDSVTQNNQFKDILSEYQATQQSAEDALRVIRQGQPGNLNAAELLG